MFQNETRVRNQTQEETRVRDQEEAIDYCDRKWEDHHRRAEEMRVREGGWRAKSLLVLRLLIFTWVSCFYF